MEKNDFWPELVPGNLSLDEELGGVKKGIGGILEFYDNPKKPWEPSRVRRYADYEDAKKAWDKLTEERKKKVMFKKWEKEE